MRSVGRVREASPSLARSRGSCAGLSPSFAKSRARSRGVGRLREESASVAETPPPTRRTDARAAPHRPGGRNRRLGTRGPESPARPRPSRNPGTAHAVCRVPEVAGVLSGSPYAFPRSAAPAGPRRGLPAQPAGPTSGTRNPPEEQGTPHSQTGRVRTGVRAAALVSVPRAALVGRGRRLRLPAPHPRRKGWRGQGRNKRAGGDAQTGSFGSDGRKRGARITSCRRARRRCGCRRPTTSGRRSPS